MQGNDQAALTHLRSGLNILHNSPIAGAKNVSNNRSAAPVASGSIRYDILRIFTILDVQATVWLGLDSYNSKVLAPFGDDPGPTAQVIECFSSFEEAEASLDSPMTELYYFRRWVEVRDKSNAPHHSETTAHTKKSELMFLLAQWRLALDVLLAERTGQIPSKDLCRINVMTINHKITTMILAATLQPDEDVIYKDSDHIFEQVLSLAVPLLQPINLVIGLKTRHSAQRSYALRDPVPMFSFPAGLIHPLYLIAIRCHNRVIRDETLSLLASSPWREGAWDSAAMAKIAERRIWQQEEGGFYDK